MCIQVHERQSCDERETGHGDMPFSDDDDDDDDDKRAAAAAAFPLHVPDFRRPHAHAHCSHAPTHSDTVNYRRPGQ